MTSYAGMVLFDHLFDSLNLRGRFAQGFAHLEKGSVFGFASAFLLLVVHFLLGFTRINELRYYDEDPYVARLLHLNLLPDVSTVTRTLGLADSEAVEYADEFMWSVVARRLEKEMFPRVTFDFDGTVQSTQGHAEGTAVGRNKVRKGARSYYVMPASIAQTGQFTGLLHRPGNLHDSNGALDFARAQFERVRGVLPKTQLEARFDSAFCSEAFLMSLEASNVRYTCSFPLERYVRLKVLIDRCTDWKRLNRRWSYAEFSWQPASWGQHDNWRILVYRQQAKQRMKGPVQLDLFKPVDVEHRYSAIITNRTGSAMTVLRFHHGRGNQEKLYGEVKQNAGLGVVATGTRLANHCYTLAGLLAHNLSRELQMRAQERSRRPGAKRPSMWHFISLKTLRQRWLHRAGRLVKPGGRTTLAFGLPTGVSAEFEALLNGAKQTETGDSTSGGLRKAA